MARHRSVLGLPLGLGLLLLRLTCGAHALAPLFQSTDSSVTKLEPWVSNVTEVTRWQDELEEEEVREGNSTEVQRRNLLAKCDYTAGKWVYSPRKKGYSGYSCPWIRSAFNCQKNGRRNNMYTQFKWNPYGCNMPQFDPPYILSRLRNKILAVVGDSFSRNVQQAIACLLHSEKALQKWSGTLGGQYVEGLIAPDYNLRIVVFVAPYLVRHSSSASDFAQYGLTKQGKDDYIVWLDQIHPLWSQAFMYCDITLFMSGHWYLESQGGKNVRGTVYVQNNQVLKVSGARAYYLAMAKVKKYVLIQRKYRGVPMWLTYSPSHYTPGHPPHCSYQAPFPWATATSYYSHDVAHFFRAIEHSMLVGSPFRLIDITKISAYRPDAHVQLYYGSARNSKTTWDCTHWCLPGLPDVWADVFQFIVQTQLRRHKRRV